jgi:hypothetical protein
MKHPAATAVKAPRAQPRQQVTIASFEQVLVLASQTLQV